MRCIIWPVLLALIPISASAADTPLKPDVFTVPGETPTPWLTYENPGATSVLVTGSWDLWVGRVPLQPDRNLWKLDTRTLGATFGQHEFKLIPDGEWEKGENRVLFINRDGLLEKPSSLIYSATIDRPDEIVVSFRSGFSANAPAQPTLSPETAIRETRFASPRESGNTQGYFVSGGLITFILEEKIYGLKLSPSDRVAVAGNFSGWDGGGGNGRWFLRDPDRDGKWELTTQLAGLRPPAGENNLIFKFVVNGDRWLPAPPGAQNAASDGKGNVNLRIDPQSSGAMSLHIFTEKPIDLSQNYMVELAGLTPKPLWSPVTPGQILEQLKSDKPMGTSFDFEQNCTTYRLFAPRAKTVHLCIFDGPVYENKTPVERYPLWKDPKDGVWEISLLGIDFGKYYSFNVDGPTGNGEGFNGLAQVGDPYARAAAHSQNNTIVIDPDATNEWWGGWTDQDYRTIAPKDAVIYELHIRDFTRHPSSGVAPPLAGKYAGLPASEGTGRGLDHLAAMGVTTLEIMPPAEFSNGNDEYNWGYAPVFYFAPEASYARKPTRGSQYYEFKNLINELHRRGFGVLLDLVFNHVGSPNIFTLIDKKYFFRLNPDYSFSNYSGCGNDFRTESPMTRRLIVENISYWMREFHVDGFRFDLAELIDMETMMAIRDAAFTVNTNALLVSEPWSFRGENKHQLKGTGWSAWNNDFRYAAKDFVMGRRNREWLQKAIAGSVDTWAANPLQPINYLESHDDMALADELCTAPNHDGRALIPNDVAVNRLAATILFTSLGIPMITEGQEFIRSKRGIHNTFDRGDAVNAIDWNDRDRPEAARALSYYTGLVHLRRSPQGAAFRASSKPPADYYKWILPSNPLTLGYCVNAPKVHGGSSFVVLLNADADPQTFQVPFPPGRWRQIGDGVTIDPDGLTGVSTLNGAQQLAIEVPSLSSAIYMDGF